MHHLPSSPISLGRYTLRNNLALAPMAGLTDVPFRTVAWEYGVGYMVSEMVGSKPQLWDTGKSKQRRIPVPGVSPQAVQIAGNCPQTMALAAQKHEEGGVDVIDINFGCPAKKVCRKAAGSALLGDIDLVEQIVRSVVDAVNVPVTAKLRLGLTPSDKQGLLAAQRCEQAGVAMLVIHARSRACKFVGDVNYEAVAQIRRSTAVPLLVNGDVSDFQSMQRALNLSGADGVMIGRGAVGQPWIFEEILTGVTVNADRRWKMVLQHVQSAHKFYGPGQGVRLVRKHVAAYLRHLKLDWAIANFQKLEEAEQQLNYLALLKQKALDQNITQAA